MGDHRDATLGAEVEQPCSHCAVIERAQCHLDGGDLDEVDGLFQPTSIDVREPHAPDRAFVEQACEGAQRRPPGCSRVRRMDEVQVDRQPVQGGEARLAIAENRLGATVRNPAAVRPRHASFGHDPRAPIRAASAQRPGDEPLVAAHVRLTGSVRVRGVEDGDPGIDGGGDRVARKRVVTIGVGRDAHAAETDAKVVGSEPPRDCSGLPSSRPAGSSAPQAE